MEVLSCTVVPTCTKGVNHREEQREQPRLVQPVPSIHHGASEVMDPSNSPLWRPGVGGSPVERLPRAPAVPGKDSNVRVHRGGSGSGSAE